MSPTSEKSQAILNLVPAMIWLSDETGGLIYVNRQWLDFTGRSFDEEKGEGWIATIHPEDLPQMESMRTNAAKREPFQVIMRMRGKDGRFRWMLKNGVPRYDEAGRFAGYIGTCVDVTDRMNDRAELERTAEKLERSNKDLEQFAYVASHDLQEPLRKIIAFSERLRDRSISGLGDVERDYFERMQSAARRMKILIEDLLNFSRAATQEAPREAVNLRAIVNEAVSDLEASITQKKARIRVEELPTANVNPLQMRRLFQNLIGNALKFSKPGVVPEIVVSCAPWQKGEAKGSEIRVRDNGIGFEEKFLERIFKPFQRLHARSEYEGSGIGLAICRKIVERQGGELDARSTPGEGSTFYVRLPD